MADYALTKGGITAHITRRLIHISIIFIPFLYYFVLIPDYPIVSLHIAIIILLLLLTLFEFFRVQFRLLLFGQREHEATHFSSFGWTILSLGLVLLFAPNPALAIAIVSSCALADPLLGEMRACAIAKWKIIFSGILVVLGVWLSVSYFYNIPYFWAFFMAPFIVALEWPSLKWIDDNALMMLVPLIIVIAV